MTFSHPTIQLSFDFDEAPQAVGLDAKLSRPTAVAVTVVTPQVVSLSSFRLKKEMTEKISLHRQILETIVHMA